MDRHAVEEIVQRENRRRLIFRYYKDRYALLLLRGLIGQCSNDGAERATGQAIPIQDLRRTHFAPLLHKPAVKPALANAGDGLLTADRLEMVWPTEWTEFVLDFGVWEDDYEWAQVSRPGANLVIRLNFSNRHDSRFKQVFRADPNNQFNGWGHPVTASGRTTLAWARVDYDPQSGDALIEEIQNDWIRYFENRLRYSRKHCKPQCRHRLALEQYALFLKLYRKIWAEALLAATLEYLTQEMGYRRIFYHSFETSCVLKGLQWDKPPRSIYEQVPRQFLMRSTSQTPEFLRSDRRAKRRLKKLPNARWYAPTVVPMGGLYHA